jgi:hypothetical protein
MSPKQSRHRDRTQGRRHSTPPTSTEPATPRTSLVPQARSPLRRSLTITYLPYGSNNLVEHPRRAAPTDLVDTENLDRLRFGGQHLFGVGGERRGHHRPRHAVIPRGLHHRAPTVSDRRTRRAPQPGGQPLAWWNVGRRLGKRLSTTSRLVAPPPPFTPHQSRTSPTDLKISWTSHPQALRPARTCPALRADPGPLIRGDQMHDRAGRSVLDSRHGQALQAQQPGRILDHARGSSVVTSLLRQQA